MSVLFDGYPRGQAAYDEMVGPDGVRPALRSVAAELDRLGLDEAHTQIMGVPIPLLTIPVSAGRNLAGIVELAVMNNRQKKYGINSAREFVEQIDSHIDHQAAQEKNR